MEADSTFPSGAPCWIDTDQPDVAAARSFYGELFGWSFADAPPPAPPGSYAVARLGAGDVGGLAGVANGGARWTVYVAVADLSATLSRVEALDGRVAAGPDDAGPAGRSARLVDPGGAELGLWEPGRRRGADVVDLPGTWTVPVLRASEVAVSLTFYELLFGWRGEPVDGVGDGPAVTAFHLPGYGERRGTGDDAVALLVHAVEGEHAGWYPSLVADDLGGTVERAGRLGVAVVGQVMAVPGGPRLVLRDPQGALFALTERR